jgi:hypothetical protein
MDDMRYQWGVMGKLPNPELARLALDQPEALNLLTEHDLAQMTSGPVAGGPLLLETSTIRLPGQGLEVTLRVSRLNLPSDFSPNEEGFQNQIEEVLGTVQLRLGLIRSAFAHGADYQRRERDRCVPVDLYRVTEIRLSWASNIVASHAT